MARNKVLKIALSVLLSVLLLGATPLCAWGIQSTDIVDDTITPSIPVTPILSAPAAPTGLKATLGSDVSIELTWKDNSSNETGFVIQRKINSASYADAITVPNVNATVWTDLLAGTGVINDKIYYRVRAVNSIGDSSYSNEVMITLVNPSPAKDLAVTFGYDSGKGKITLTWTNPSPSLTDFFKVERSVNSGAFESIGVTDKDSYDDTGLNDSTLYTYRIYTKGYFGGATSSTIGYQTPDAAPAETTTEPAVTEDEDGPDFNGASDWAKSEIQEAYDLNLTTDTILSHYSNNITREEFCEIAVKLYEALSSKNALPAIVNPFTDTSNETVLKAFDLGIIKGTSDTTFSPNNPITRQEICVMIYRALKADNPDLDMDTSGVSAFSDQSSIASWAIDAVRYANKNNIMKGTGGNNISPLNNTSREQAIVLLKRTYENFH